MRKRVQWRIGIGTTSNDAWVPCLSNRSVCFTTSKLEGLESAYNLVFHEQFSGLAFYSSVQWKTFWDG